MKQIKSDILLWILLAIIVIVENTAYSMGFIYTQIDYVFVTAVILLLKGKRYTAFIFIIIASAIHDFFVLPFAGLTILGQLTALIAVRMLCDTLYKDNYVTKIFILLAGESIKWFIHAVLVIVFYWEFKVEFIPIFMLPTIILSTLAGAVVIKLMEFNLARFVYWLMTTLGKR